MTEPIKVTVWNEFRHEKQNSHVKSLYPEGIHGALTSYLSRQPDIEARGATLIKLGIIGTGVMAKWHGDEYNKMKGVNITACCDVVEKTARKFSEYKFFSCLPSVPNAADQIFRKVMVHGRPFSEQKELHSKRSILSLQDTAP